MPFHQLIIGFFNQNIGTVGKFVLFPIYIALILYVILYFAARNREVPLSEEFHKKSFFVSLSVIFGWLIYALTPSTIKLPLEVISLRAVILIIVVVLTVQYLTYLGVELIAPEKTIVALGIGAGTIRSTLAVSVMAPLAAEDETLSYTAAASIMIANTVAVLRNFLIILVVGLFLGLYIIPPFFFLAPMFLMLIACGTIAFILYRKSQETEPVEFDPISIKGTILFIVIFVVSFYLAFGIAQAQQFIGFYAFSGIAGFLYGAAHLFVITGLFFSKTLTLNVGLIGAVFVTAGSIISDIPYAYLNGAEELTKILIVAEAIPVAIGIITLFLYAPLL
ncbi:TPA: DUF4010 domain-containing protein [archaeon]|uniref:DUF4010 domain-containing protein n=1 Tax=Candidatus Naiadarchaeum limnaeum TaxID=2756139 RepID=A0A832V1C4_9ARCH|nr:DUF4010 domain-containing protein [Candidatus Naiadarchaeales archaeon SRR2090153.bin1042]HIK00281.1 DUF4010 domain-containing protein [Candidatus Naiadarchaeum limnaeum]